MIEALVTAVFETLFQGTGRLLFGLFGKRPHSLAMMFTGMALWILVGIGLYSVFR